MQVQGNYNLQNLLNFANSAKQDNRLQSQFDRRYGQLYREAMNTTDESNLQTIKQNATNYYEKNKSDMDDWTIDAWTTFLGEYDVDDNGTYIGGDLNAHIDKVKGHNMGMEVNEGYANSLVDLMDKYNYIAEQTIFQTQNGIDDWGDPIYEDLDYSSNQENLEQLRTSEREKLKGILTNYIAEYNTFRKNHQSKYDSILSRNPNDFNTLNHTSELFGLSVELVDDDNLFDIKEKQSMLNDIANPMTENYFTNKYIEGEVVFNERVKSSYMDSIEENLTSGSESKSLLNARERYHTEWQERYIKDGEEIFLNENDSALQLEWYNEPALDSGGNVIPHPSGKQGEYITVGDLIEGTDAEVNEMFNNASKTYADSKKLLSNLNNKVFDLTDGTQNYLQALLPSILDDEWRNEVESIAGIDSGFIPMSYENVVKKKEDRIRYNSEGFPIWEAPVVVEDVEEDESLDLEERIEIDPKRDYIHKDIKTGRTTEYKGDKKIVTTRGGYTLTFGRAPKGATIHYSTSAQKELIWENLYRYKSKHNKIPQVVIDEVANELYGSNEPSNTSKVMQMFIDLERDYAESKGIASGEYKKITTELGPGVLRHAKTVDYQFIPESDRAKPELRPWEETFKIGSPASVIEYDRESKDGKIVSGWDVTLKGYAPIDGQYFREDVTSYINLLLKNHNNDIGALIQFTKEVSGLGIDMDKNQELKKEFKKIGNRIRTLIDKEEQEPFQVNYMKSLNDFTNAVGIDNYGPPISRVKKEVSTKPSTKGMENKYKDVIKNVGDYTFYEVQDAYRIYFKQRKKEDVDFRKRWSNFAEFWKYKKPQEQGKFKYKKVTGVDRL